MRCRFVFIAAAWACTVQARPVFVPDSSVVQFDEIGLYEVGWAYRGQSEHQFPIGWSGTADERTGVMCELIGTQAGKSAFLLHCPWRGGTGIAFQQFTVQLPRAPRIHLRGATALRADIVEKSDGATFRVFINGTKLLDVHRTDAQWQPFDFDLTQFAESTVTIRFETDPGPRNNASFDFSLWGDRELVLEGYQPPPVPHRAPPPVPLAKLLSAENGSVVPPSAFSARVTSELTSAGAVFRYAAADGTLEYRWRDGESLFGNLVLLAPAEIPLATTAALDWTQPVQLQTNFWERTAAGISRVQKFQAGETTATVRVTGQLVGKSLVFDVSCDQPLVGSFDAGGWGPVLRRRTLPMPYYSGNVDYLPREDLFVNSFLDWTIANAARHEHNRAHYVPLTDGRRNLLHERAVFSAAWHAAEVLPNIPNPPSPWRKQIADKIVLDIWGGRFTDIAAKFETLADYGIRNCVALIHDWQRDGYDNGLPAHFPANARLGGDDGMKTLVATGTRFGYFIALHENYVDYYPNYEHFAGCDIALDSRGDREKAWFNPGTGSQSFAVKPTAIVRLAATQSPEIHKRYGTNANYLDVHSGVPSWFHVDQDARESGAGNLQTVRQAHRDLWEYERRVHGGPVFGEGNQHWHWSGLLDGVEAQFGSGWVENGGLAAPLLVDFDLLKIHPLQFNHGMGYYERWWPQTFGHVVPPLVVLDQYRVQEIAYGHAGFLGGAAWSMVPLAWLEHHLLSPVMARYATARPELIDYNGRDCTAAAKTGGWQQVRIRYDNGLTITANSSHDSMRAGEHLLPQFGWLAEGAGVTAYTAVRDGVVVDFAQTADSVFANARNAAHWNLAGIRRVRPSVAQCEQIGDGELRVRYRWQVNDSLAKDYDCFVHFGADDDRGIRFQQDHALAVPTTQWPPGATISDGPHTVRVTADGDYGWFIGLWAPGSDRVALEGPTDGHERIKLGVLHVHNGGKSIQFEPEHATGDERVKLYNDHLNLAGRIIDFGPVRTDGSVFVRREGNEWVLQTWPRDKNFTVELAAGQFGRPPRVQCVGGAAASVEPQAQGARWRLPLTGAKQYRWRSTR